MGDNHLLCFFRHLAVSLIFSVICEIWYFGIGTSENKKIKCPFRTCAQQANRSKAKAVERSTVNICMKTKTSKCDAKRASFLCAA